MRKSVRYTMSQLSGHGALAPYERKDQLVRFFGFDRSEPIDVIPDIDGVTYMQGEGVVTPAMPSHKITPLQEGKEERDEKGVLY